MSEKKRDYDRTYYHKNRERLMAYYQRRREIINKRKRARYKSSVKYRDNVFVMNKKYRDANREKTRLRQYAWLDINREKINTRRRYLYRVEKIIQFLRD